MPTPVPKWRLYDLALDRVDLCGAGANPAADIVLFKSKEDDVPQPKKKAKAPAKKVKGKADARSKSKQRGDEDEEDDEDDDAVTKSEDDEDDDEDVDEDDDVEKSDDDEDEEDVDDDEDDEDEDDDPAPKKKTAKKSAAKKPAKKAKADDGDGDDLEDEDDDADEDDAEVDEKVLKSLPPSVRRQVERNARIAKRATQRAKEAFDLVTTEKHRREHLEYIEKAKDIIPNLPGTDEDKGSVLQSLYSGQPLDKDLRKTLIRMLKSGNTAMAFQMAEDGPRSTHEDTDDDSPLGQLHEKADDLLAKDSKLTKSSAFTKACELNPKLYNQYRQAKRRERDVN